MGSISIYATVLFKAFKPKHIFYFSLTELFAIFCGGLWTISKAIDFKEIAIKSRE